MNVFTYGTLTDARCVNRVLGHDGYTMTMATLNGYEKYRGPGGYWYASHNCRVEDDGEFLSGMLLSNLTDTDMSRLRIYEAGLYDEKTVNAVTEDGDDVSCLIFVKKV